MVVLLPPIQSIVTSSSLVKKTISEKLGKAGDTIPISSRSQVMSPIFLRKLFKIQDTRSCPGIFLKHSAPPKSPGFTNRFRHATTSLNSYAILKVKKPPFPERPDNDKQTTAKPQTCAKETPIR